MKVGSLVVPTAEREYIFLESAECDEDEVLDEIEWQSSFGVVLNISEFDPPREYMRVRVLIGNTVGWTYTDYIQDVF